MQKANKGELSNLKNKLLAEQVQEQIYQYILETPIAVGAKLPNEFELGDRFSVGRSTIREAVKLLISRGILEVRRGSGTYVVSTTPVDMDPLGLGAVEDKMALALDLVNCTHHTWSRESQRWRLSNATRGGCSEAEESV